MEHIPPPHTNPVCDQTQCDQLVADTFQYLVVPSPTRCQSSMDDMSLTALPAGAFDSLTKLTSL